MAKSSKGTTFFFENEGRGSALGSGETAKADPAYKSHLVIIVDRASDACSCFASGLPLSFFMGSSLLIFESSDAPRRRTVTFSITASPILPALPSSEPDLLETEGSGWADRRSWFSFSERTSGCCCFLLGLGFGLGLKLIRSLE